MIRTTIDADGPVSILDYGGDGPLIVCVHGLEGSAFNWNLIGPELAETHRVVAVDLSGFGYSPPVERGSTVEANAELVAHVVKHYGSEAILIGNSMGGLVSMIAAESDPDLVRGLVLIAPAAPVSSWLSVSVAATARLSTPLIPVLGSKLIDLYRSTQTAEEGVEEALEFVSVDPDSLDPQVWDDALEIAQLRRTQPWSTKALVEATNSIAPYVLRKPRFANMLHRVSQPTLLVHGLEDNLIQARTARWMARERPDWTAAFFEDVGHVPMLEAPNRMMSVFNAWEQAVLTPVS